MGNIVKYFKNPCPCYFLVLLFLDRMYHTAQWINGLDFQTLRFIDFSSHLDDEILFLPNTIWLYYLYYPLLGLPLFLKLKTPSDLNKSLILCCCVTIPVFILFPSYLPHPTLINLSAGTDFLFKILYTVDKPTNCFPSLHCAYSVMICLAYWYQSAFQTSNLKRLLKALIFLMTIAICVSTVLIKQHFILDSIFGCILGFIIFYRQKICLKMWKVLHYTLYQVFEK